MGTEGDLATPEFEDFKKGTEGKIENILLLVPHPGFENLTTCLL